MNQLAIRSRAPAERELGQSLGRWHRETRTRHRDYSPTLGRFIERDPVGFEAGDGNWYRFVANGPTRRTDPSGLQYTCAMANYRPFVPGLPDIVRTKRQKKDYRPPTNGCSTPWGGDGFFLFTTACNKHDVCYGTCGSDRAACDKAFLDAMVEHCRAINVGLLGQLGYVACLEEAGAFYRAVRFAGQSYWNAAQNDACEWEPRECRAGK